MPLSAQLRRWIAVLLMTALAMAGASAALAQPRIAGFKAFLFNSRNGTLSRDVLTDTAQLGNVMTGDLSSVSTFVVVTVAFGPRASVPDHARVRLVARTAGRRGRVLLDRSARLGPVDEDGTTHVGFWLDDTGCDTIDFRAVLVGGGTPAHGEATLPFACYE
ncbi:hypothetical protein [Sphingomonas sp.]|uniref:hypothetical protein n=1 Tax=Sphingomonas sp. TaxID=28214 RepID=UPI003CC5705E